jgi:hypothetical protein
LPLRRFRNFSVHIFEGFYFADFAGDGFFRGRLLAGARLR